VRVHEKPRTRETALGARAQHVPNQQQSAVMAAALPRAVASPPPPTAAAAPGSYHNGVTGESASQRLHTALLQRGGPLRAPAGPLRSGLRRLFGSLINERAGSRATARERGIT
jgi:hypothetical protein